MKDVVTCLMFSGPRHGKARAAMETYTSLFPNSSIEKLQLYGAGSGAPEGTVQAAWFSLNGRRLMVTDSPVDHAFNFTPSMSLFVECESQGELERLFGALADGGKVLMPLNNYGFSQHFGWTEDRFGVSWQLNLA